MPPIDRASALFLDFDGTLVDIAPTPEAVHVEPALIDALLLLTARLGGALALVSGRPIAQLDALLAPLELPAAGVHGAERRRADGEMQRLSPPALDAVADAAQTLALRHAGLRVERKLASVALHYRNAPHCEAACIDAMNRAAARDAGLRVLRGKMVVEVLPAGIDKGHAIEAFLREEPFAARAPIFVGDDVTDETGFVFVASRGGRTIKVGDGETMAGERIESPAAVRRWLRSASALP